MNGSRPLKSVCIVGGGTAGWLSALHIRSALQNTPVSVTLVQSPDVPSIGVGEGTQPTLREQLRRLVVSEDDCLRGCGGSYKNGIRFVGWNGAAGPETYDHPFFSGTEPQRDGPTSNHQIWLAQHHRDAAAAGRLAERCFCETALMTARKAPIGFQDGKRLQSPVANYALHIDAIQLGSFLAKKAVERGVRRIDAHVADVRLDSQGNVASVVTKEQGEIAADFFVDCTGFKRLLIGKLNSDYEDFSPYLFNDRAVTARIPHAAGAPINPYTTSSALKNGWVWNVPLRDRTGYGYVYSSRFTSDEAALGEFVAFLGREPEHTEVIRFRTGSFRRQWERNCVAIGLSSGFIEPLEATGVALITYSLYKLMELWPTLGPRPILQDRFNRAMSESYEWVRDFIVMHYCLSRRDDSEYWNAVRRPEAIPDTLHARLEYFDYGWPFGDSFEPTYGFRLPTASLACILAGFGRLPRGPNVYAAGLPAAYVDRQLAQIAARTKSLLAICPDHAQFLRAQNG